MLKHPHPLAFLLALALPFCACSEKNSEQGAANDGVEVASGSSAQAGNDQETAIEANEKEAELVRVEPIKRRLVRKTLLAVADVISLDEVDIFPERTQPVVELLAEEGDQVQIGQVLARLRDDVESLAVTEAALLLANAKNEFLRSERDHQRNIALMESEAAGSTKLISERELETSRQAVESARTSWEAGKVSLSRAELELGQTVLTAPISGTVAVREISLGDMASPASRAFRLVDVSKPKAIFYRPQRELSVLHVGQKFTATCEALPGRILSGKLERIAPIVDAESGTVKITAALDTGRGLVPIGVLISLELVLDEHPDALMVPKRAVLFEGTRLFVFVVRDEIAHKVRIEPGFEEADYIEALPGGDLLESSDQLVVVGNDRLEHGDRVELAE